MNLSFACISRNNFINHFRWSVTDVPHVICIHITYLQLRSRIPRGHRVLRPLDCTARLRTWQDCTARNQSINPNFCRISRNTINELTGFSIEQYILRIRIINNFRAQPPKIRIRVLQNEVYDHRILPFEK